MKKLILLLFLVLSVDAFSARIGSDQVIIGKKGSSADKVLVMGGQDAGLKKTSEGLMFNHGDGNGYYKMGTGSGSGGSTAINNLDNSGFEEGIATNWSCTTDKCSESSTDLNGNKSLQFDPTAQGNYFESTLKAITPGLMGRSCEARVFYLGGDENLTAQVINGNATPIAEEVLKAHSVAGYESVGFICPTQAEIDADSDVGDLKLKVVNATGTPAASSKFDDMHLGATNGLVEMTTPDGCSLVTSGTSVLRTNCGDGILVENPATGEFNLNITSMGLSVAPAVQAIAMHNSGTQADCSVALTGDPSNTAVGIFVRYESATAYNPAYIHWTITKQGADAKQSVQVYRNIPKVSENINDFVAELSTSNAISKENTDWLAASCTGTTVKTCALQNGLQNEDLTCSMTILNDATHYDLQCYHNPQTTGSNLIFRCSDAGGLTDPNSFDPVGIKCTKNGSNYKTPTVQPIVVGQLRNGYAESTSKNVHTEHCIVNNSGTPTSASNLCNNWIASYVLNSAGNVTVNFVSGTFSEKPVCTVTAAETSNAQPSVWAAFGNYGTEYTKDKVRINISDFDGSESNQNFMLSCTGY